MQAFETSDVLRQQQAARSRYLEFLRQSSLSMGLYVLPAGSVDEQQPHTEDEVYYVVSGRARFMADGDDVAVQPGSILFVAALAEHRFHSIEAELQILVFFAPAEYANQSAHHRFLSH